MHWILGQVPTSATTTESIQLVAPPSEFGFAEFLLASLPSVVAIIIVLISHFFQRRDLQKSLKFQNDSQAVAFAFQEDLWTRERAVERDRWRDQVSLEEIRRSETRQDEAQQYRAQLREERARIVSQDRREGYLEFHAKGIQFQLALMDWACMFIATMETLMAAESKPLSEDVIRSCESHTVERMYEVNPTNPLRICFFEFLDATYEVALIGSVEADRATAGITQVLVPAYEIADTYDGCKEIITTNSLIEGDNAFARAQGHFRNVARREVNLDPEPA